MIPFYGFLIVILVALFPAFVWLWFFLKEDLHPEPKRLILYTFCVGAIITMPVLFLQVLFQELYLSFFFSTLISIIGLALIEEVFKFFAAFSAVNSDKRFDEPIDAMIYSIVAALGFATVENLFIAANAFDSYGSLVSISQTMLLRFVGATLLHALASSVVGYYWARARILGKFFPSIFLGLLYATILHGVFNYLVLHFQYHNLFYPTLFLVFVALFVLHNFEVLKKRLTAFFSRSIQKQVIS